MSDSDSDAEVTRLEAKKPNKRQHQENSSDGLVFPKKTSKVTTLTPTPKASLSTSNRFQDLPLAIDPTPKQPPAEPKPAPIQAYIPNYKKLILDLSVIIKNPTQYKFLTDHLLIKTANIMDYQKVIKHLESSNIHYFTYSIKASRPIKYILKHLPNDLRSYPTSPPKAPSSTRYQTCACATAPDRHASLSPHLLNLWPCCRKQPKSCSCVSPSNNTEGVLYWCNVTAANASVVRRTAAGYRLGTSAAAESTGARIVTARVTTNLC